jgi:peptide/nickel transport system substrate-binding protein
MSFERVSVSRRRLIGLSTGAISSFAICGATFLRADQVNAASLYGLQGTDVPRNRTMVLVGNGGEQPNTFPDVENQNPYVATIRTRSGWQLGYEPLAFYNMLGGEEKMWLGESYEYNADFTELTVKIRPDGKWSDGESFKAADIAFTLKMLADPANSLLDFATPMAQWVKDAVAVDDVTAKITLNAPNPRFFFNYLTQYSDIGIMILPSHIWETAGTPADFTNFDLAKGWPVMTGAYKLVQSTSEQKVWDLRPDWWAAAAGVATLPEVQRLIFLPPFEESRMAQLVISNDADITLNIAPATMPSLFQQNPKIITHSGQEPPYGYTDWWPSGLGFNCMVAPWDNPDVRWAVSYAIDRQQLVDFGYRGAGEPTTVPYPYYAGLLTYIDGIKDLLEQYPTNAYDLSKTDELMTKAGFAKDGDGFWAKDGTRLKVEITTFQVFGEIVPIVTEQLKKAGFDSTFGMPTDFFDRLTLGNDNVYIWGHGGSVRDPYATLELYESKWIKPIGESAYPFYRWSNPEFDAIVDEMGITSPDDPKTAELFRSAMEIWLRELPDVMLLQFYHRIPMNTTYWTGWPSTEDPYINEAFWHRTFINVLTHVKAAQ